MSTERDFSEHSGARSSGAPERPVWSRLIDFCISPELRKAGAPQQRRARLMAGYVIASLPLAAMFTFLYPLFAFEAREAGLHIVLSVTTTSALIGTAALLKYTAHLRLVGLMGSAIAYTMTTFSCYQAGGLAGPGAVWLLASPIISIMFLGRGILGQSWVGVSALTLMVFGYLHYQGLLVAPVVPDVPLYLANAVGACALIVALFWFYDLEGDRFYAELVEMRDRAQEASRAKSAFLANTSHEMRTPLSAVIGFADLLRDELESGELSRCNDMVDTIRRNGRHLLSVINDVLDLSRVESGKLQLERGVVSPRELLREVQRIVEPRAHQRGLELQLSVDDAAPGLVAADPTRLRQVLLNLLDNAVRFTDQGKVRIHATAARLGGEPAIAFEVADTGIGMTEAQLRFAFEPFTQADASTTRTRGGTGLGLSISDRIVQLMGGSIEASSVVGEGSSFRVTVPVGSPEQSDEIPTPTRPLAEMGRALEGLRLLLAEDGPDNQRLIRMFVERAGAQVEVAADGIEAVERYFAAELAARPFDAILMDMDMPRMDGYEATRVLRGRGCELPVIALTAHAMAFDRERCLQAGCDEYLSKPVDRSNLVSVIAAFASKPAPEAETPEA